ncbi:MAG: hypothetical protein VX044_09010, partial [Planctomycetota bacterium]|nr:hypothetical protein [Planctomycetota bacterium]
RSQQPFLVMVGGRPRSGPLPDALVEAPSGADVAVDLALLACAGAPPTPTTYSIGARTWDATTRAAGGAPTLAPADVIIAMLRQQRADLLTARPPQGARHRIAFVAAADGHAAQRTEVRDAAAKYRHVELVEAGSAADAVAAGAAALILATDDPRVTREALATAGSVVVLDPMLRDAPGACRIGCAPETAARAAAARIRALLPEGGDLIVCGPDGGDAWGQAVRDAIVTALGIDPASVR